MRHGPYELAAIMMETKRSLLLMPLSFIYPTVMRKDLEVRPIQYYVLPRLAHQDLLQLLLI